MQSLSDNRNTRTSVYSVDCTIASILPYEYEAIVNSGTKE